ncbi:hypothetical protein FACS1894169_00920 [Bacteroidia bacterium]|nr:hypothetical protein FACS1894169_00920 [Bacteroidia bacterium]
MEIKEIVEKTKRLKTEYMFDLKQIIEINPPEVVGEQTQRKEVFFSRCGYCKGKGWFYNGGYSQKFKKNLSNPNYEACPYCKATGKVKAVVSVEWLPHGEVIEVEEDNELI